MSQAPRPRGIGCVAILSVFCLSLFTLGEVALVWRLNPDWFDRHAFWRGPILAPDLVVVQDAASRDARKRAFEAKNAKKPAAKAGKVEMLESASVSGDYDPAREMTLTNKAAAKLHISAGAVGEAAKIRMTPVMRLPEPMRAALAGPVYDVRIGAHEHYDFRGNVTITLPYRAEFHDDQPVIAVWEGKAWKHLPTTIDAQQKTVTAVVPHVSLLGVLGKAWRFAQNPLTIGRIAGIGAPALSLTLFVATDPTARGNLRAGVWWLTGGRNKETPNFVIHYTTEGDHAVIQDRPYVLRKGRDSGEHPLFVEDVAKWLEEASVRLDAQGLKLPPPKLFKHDVFLTRLDDLGDELGNSDLGGPLILSTKLSFVAFDQNDTVDPEGLMRAVVAHELTHVAQGASFSTVGGYRWRWFLEMSAEFMGDRCWKPEANYDTLRKFTLAYVGDNSEPMRADRLPAFPFDSTDDTKYYSHALFFSWLDARKSPDGGLKVVLDMNERGDGSLASLDQATRKVLQTPLAELFAEYASDFYYRDLWRGDLTPRPHTRITPREQMLAQIARSGGPEQNLGFAEQTFGVLTGNGERNDVATTTVPALPHLTAVPLYVHAGTLLPEARKGRLVIKVAPRDSGLPAHLRLLHAVDKVGNASLPLRGGAGTLAPMPLNNQSFLINGFGTVGGNDRATVLLINDSLTESAGGLEVSRWLLLAPSWLRAERQGAPGTANGRTWKLAWHKAELRDFPETFKGYSLYRRKLGDGPPGWSVREFGEVPPNWSLIKEDCIDETYTDNAPDDEEYVYAIRVKDVLGNYSEAKVQDDIDPWVGTWEDNVRLIEGSFVAALRMGLTKANEESDRKELARIGAIADPAEQQRQAQNLQKHRKERKEIQDVILDIIEVGEHATRIGIPLEMKIRRGDNRYFLAISKAFWQDTGWTPADDIELERVDANTLKFKNLPQEFPPLYLRLHRAPAGGQAQMRGDWTLEIPNDANRNRFKFAWNFHRK